MLAGLLGRIDEQGKTNEQLLKLYWNRASVKREVSSLRRERYKLLDRLKDQEGAIARAKEQLEGLERLLTNPLAAANAMVYFQLRHLWRVAAQYLEQTAAELQRRHEQRERAQLHEAALAKRRRRLAAIEAKKQSLFRKRRKVIEQSGRLEQRLSRMNALSRLFAGPRLRRRIRGLKNGRGILENRLQELKELAEKLDGEQLPDIDGVSVGGRRWINATLIALAQELVLHFSEHDLATLAKTSMERSVGDMKFGDRRECDRMVERIRERLEELRKCTSMARRLELRAGLLSTQVRYRNETDAVPMAECMDRIQRVLEPPAGNTGRRSSDKPLAINVLVDDYWDVHSVLR